MQDVFVRRGGEVAFQVDDLAHERVGRRPSLHLDHGLAHRHSHLRVQQQLQGQGEGEVAREHGQTQGRLRVTREPLTVGVVGRRVATAGGAVVDEVVVHQAVGLQQLDAQRRGVQPFDRLGRHQAGCYMQQDNPHPLPAPQGQLPQQAQALRGEPAERRRIQPGTHRVEVLLKERVEPALVSGDAFLYLLAHHEFFLLWGWVTPL